MTDHIGHTIQLILYIRVLLIGEGWFYTVSFNTDNRVVDNDAKRARKRRLIRHRKILNSEKGWMNELKNKSIMNSMLKTPLCHPCDQNLQRILREELAKLKEDEESYDAYVLQYEENINIVPKIKVKTRSANSKTSHISWQDDVDDEIVDLNDMSLEDLLREENILLELLQDMEQTCQTLARNRELIWSCATDLQIVQQDTFGQAALIQLVHQYTKEERSSVGVFSVHASDMLRCLQ
ncbi:hypothetical protein As57867_018912, partial [Aphanomyces stellatus]